MPRRYTDTQRSQALELVAEHGIAHAHRETGIPKPTLSRWAHADGIDLERSAEQTKAATAASAVNREALREQIRTKLLAKIDDLLDRMDLPHIDFRGKDAIEVTYPKPSPEGCKAYATAAAILIDKYRLEMGEATGRHEVTGDARRRALDAVDELAARRAKKAA